MANTRSEYMFPTDPIPYLNTRLRFASTERTCRLGESHNTSGNGYIVYGRAPAAVAAGACLVTFTAETLDANGFVTTPADCVIGVGAGYIADLAFAIGEEGCVRKAPSL